MEKVKDYGTFCTICQMSYNLTTIPYVLSCGHTFCKNCTDKCSDYSSYNSKWLYQCPVCRKNNDAPSKNFSLIEILTNDDNFEGIKSKKIGYCADHDVVLSLDSLYEHRTHDWFLLSDERAKEIEEKKNALIIENSKAIENEIKEIQIAQKDILDIKEQNNHFNIKIEKLTQIKDRMIEEINIKASKCSSELAKLSNFKILDSINQSLQQYLKVAIESQKKYKKMFESFPSLSLAAKLGYKNSSFEVAVQHHYIDKDKYIKKDLEPINYLESINCGYLIFENSFSYYGE